MFVALLLGAFVGAADPLAEVAHAAGPADPALSTIASAPPTVVADGTSTSTVTVTLIDVEGMAVTAGGDTVALSQAGVGSLSTVTDNGDGTYSATVTADALGESLISFEVNGVPGAATTSIDFVAGPFDPNASTIRSFDPDFGSPAVVLADGTEIATVLISLRDASGNPVGAGDTVAITTDIGEVILLTHNGGGTYQGDLVSTISGVATVGFTVAGVPGANTTTVTFLGGPADASASSIAASPTAVIADGESTAAITVTARDVNGNELDQGGATVTMASTLGTIGAVTDNADGTYTAVLTSPTSLGSAAISFTLNGAPGSASAAVAFLAGPADAATSVIAVSPTTLPADGESTATITVTVRDANGNDLGRGGDAVAVTSALGTIGAVTDNGDGTYTAVLASSTTPGTAEISYSLNGAIAPATTAVTFVPVPPAPAPEPTSGAGAGELPDTGLDIETAQVFLAIGLVLLVSGLLLLCARGRQARR